MLEEENFQALPRLADDWVDERLRLYVLQQQNASLPPKAPAKPDPNDDKSSSRSFIAVLPRSHSNQGNHTADRTTSRTSRMLTFLTSHCSNQSTTFRTQSRAFFKSVSATKVKDSLHSLLRPKSKPLYPTTCSDNRSNTFCRPKEKRLSSLVRK